MMKQACLFFMLGGGLISYGVSALEGAALDLRGVTLATFQTQVNEWKNIKRQRFAKLAWSLNSEEMDSSGIDVTPQSFGETKPLFPPPMQPS